jgi:hypothetical protein
MSVVFRGRIISKARPPRSPNLTSPDYYLWGPMKGAVYNDNPHALFELKKAIPNIIRNIPAIELSSEFPKR